VLRRFDGVTFASPLTSIIFPASVNILINLLLAIWILVALLMMFVILMQRPKSEGLGAAFGGAVTENIFGAQTTNVLVKFTGWLAGTFFVITFALSILYAHRSVASNDTALRRELLKKQAAQQASPAPAGSQPAPLASAAPDSRPGVLPAGSATPMASPAANAPMAPVTPTASPAASSNPPRKP
jgi:preprotein translocase subunit SecG